MIADSGERREFQTGAVRDLAEGKGRCDLLPLKVVYSIMGDGIIEKIALFMETKDEDYIYGAINLFNNEFSNSIEDAILEVAIHFEEGAKKYSERNWERGINWHCYIDSGVRHYLKFLRGDTDERHDRAFLWNMMCLLWTMEHHPELDDLPKAKVSDSLPLV